MFLLSISLLVPLGKYLDGIDAIEDADICTRHCERCSSRRVDHSRRIWSVFFYIAHSHGGIWCGGVSVACLV